MAAQRNRIRIIGGRHRGRKLTFPGVPGLRPTPDRVRETLFNWLMPHLPGARVLDLFAGSGALGLEALSRGAREVVLVESDAAARRLNEHLQSLGETAKALVLQRDALRYLSATPEKPFDIVFLDPPYAANLLPACIMALEAKPWLADPAWIYLEVPVVRGVAALPELPANWKVYRSKQAGQVGYHLLHRQAPESTWPGDSGTC